MATQVAALQRTADAGKSTGGPPLPEELRRLRREARERFLAGRKAETQYAIQLLGLAPQGELGWEIPLSLHLLPPLFATWRSAF
jgi:hypothetical protein